MEAVLTTTDKHLEQFWLKPALGLLQTLYCVLTNIWTSNLVYIGHGVPWWNSFTNYLIIVCYSFQHLVWKHFIAMSMNYQTHQMLCKVTHCTEHISQSPQLGWLGGGNCMHAVKHALNGFCSTPSQLFWLQPLISTHIKLRALHIKAPLPPKRKWITHSVFRMDKTTRRINKKIYQRFVSSKRFSWL